MKEYERRAKRNAKRKLKDEHNNKSDYEAGMH